jgi:hypothetical protein
VARQHAAGTGQSQKRHDHGGWIRIRLGRNEIVNRARRKVERHLGAEAYGFVLRRTAAADGRSLRRKPLKQSDRLKEVEGEPFLEELLRD